MRIDVKKTYKLFIGGEFPRSESGRSYEVYDAKGNFLANPALASRKDLRDAVVSSRGAAEKWEKTSAFNRSQILYRVANPHIGFGAGIHFCLGAPLARMEMSVSLPALLKTFNKLDLVDLPKRRETFSLRGYEKILVSA